MNKLLKLKELLDTEYEWPHDYMFKFIANDSNKIELLSKFEKSELVGQRPSKKGTYISYTFKKLCKSSDQVLEIYNDIAKIEGIISL